MSYFKGKGLAVILLMVLLVTSFTLTGCLGRSSKQQAEKNGGAVQNITVAGSTSVQPLTEKLAGEFAKNNPGKRIYVQGGGSSAGIQAVKTGAADIGTSSRQLKSNEKGPKEIIIARDAIALVVNPQNPIQGLTMEQIKGIFAGEITNWQQVGGPNQAIRAFTREEGSGTRGAFEEIVMGDSKISGKLLVQNSTGGVKQGVVSDPSAIGYVSLGVVDEKVKILAVDGIVPSEESVAQNQYKIARPFLFLTQEQPRKELVNQFINYALSPEGQRIVAEDFIPVKSTQ